jgi:hypothetical protein
LHARVTRQSLAQGTRAKERWAKERWR